MGKRHARAGVLPLAELRRLLTLGIAGLGPQGGSGGLESAIVAKSVSGFGATFLPVSLAGEKSGFLQRWEDPAG